MTQKILKATSKGQLTLPKKWRDRFDTDNFVIELHAEQAILRPLKVETSDEVIFDADKDNDGQGIAIEEMMKMLNEL